ncbi:MAG: hypothetical protein U9R75_08940 [Candidatus Thermoplasmatota archaeon]|nr:hypothetical protein [Candidatus Thermoplasmatota archaeon]
MNLKYAWKNTTGWHVETVDGDDNVGKCTSIAIDGDDRPHISYYLLTNWDLRHARLVNGEWELETVDSEYKVGDGSSLAVDEYGKFFIAYFDWTNSKMKLASGNFGDWELESVDRDIWARPGGSHHTSIAIDEEGNPHIAYYYGTVERNPKYAALEGTIPGPDEFTVTACDGKVDVQWEIETLGRFDQVTGFQLLRAEDEYGVV